MYQLVLSIKRPSNRHCIKFIWSVPVTNLISWGVIRQTTKAGFQI